MASLKEALDFLRTEVAPRAEAIDADPEALRGVLHEACARGLMALKRPLLYGGPELSEAEFRTFQQEAARASGTFAFLQTQHQSAVAMLAKGAPEALAQETLPYMADGRKLVGIGFSQLRRPGAPVLTATPDGAGIRLDGHVPWVTGFGFYPDYLVGATLPDGRAVFALVPLAEGDGCRISEPMRLAAMAAAQTVTVDYEGYLVPEDRIAFDKPAGWIHANDMINIALQGHFALGCARAGVDLVRTAAARRKSCAAEGSADALEAEVEACSAAMDQSQEADTQTRLEIRAHAIDLAVRCAHAAIAATGGSANYDGHPAQRVYREALVYTVSAQTVPVMEATLARLARVGAEPR